MMKASLLSSMALIALLGLEAAPAGAEEAETPDARFGVGVMPGEPSCASFKYCRSDASALDALAGLSLREDHLAFHTEYLCRLDKPVPLDDTRLAFYLGGGPRYTPRHHKEDLFGTRTVGGVSYAFDSAPVDVFLEAGPVLDRMADGAVCYVVGIGVRFWF